MSAVNASHAQNRRVNDSEKQNINPVIALGLGDSDGGIAGGRADSALVAVKTEHSVKSVRRRAPKAQSVANKDNVVQLSAQRGVAYERSKWKRSRKRPGYLIRRMKGYSIAETEYGVSYLWVLSRKPDLTTADNSAHALAGYFNWKALEMSGLLVKERKSDRKDKTASIAG